MVLFPGRGSEMYRSESSIHRKRLAKPFKSSFRLEELLIGVRCPTQNSHRLWTNQLQQAVDNCSITIAENNDKVLKFTLSSGVNESKTKERSKVYCLSLTMKASKPIERTNVCVISTSKV